MLRCARNDDEQQKDPSRWLRPSCWQVLAGNLEHPTADINALRSEFGEHGPPAASADVERRSVAVMTVTPAVAPVTATVMAAPMAATVHAVSATMPTTMATVATSRSGSDGSSGQSERGDSCERDLAKHSVFSIC